MKKPEEIKKDIIDCMEEAIEIGKTCDAQDLLDFSDKAYVCMATTRAYIHRLEAKDAMQAQRIAELEQEIATVKQERDAAVSALHGDCSRCMFQETEKCASCRYDLEDSFNLCDDFWDWDGVCPDAEVQEDAAE